MTQIKKGLILSSVRELLITIVGVCVGLMLTNWNQNRLDRKLSAEYFDGVRVEIKANIAEVEKSVAHRKSMHAKLGKPNSKLNLSLDPALLEDVAWNLAQNNIFKEAVGSEAYLELAGLYAIQERIQFCADQASDRMSELNTIAPYHLLATLRMDMKEEEINEIEHGFARKWQPILTSWISYEEKYLKLPKEIINEK